MKITLFEISDKIVESQKEVIDDQYKIQSSRQNIKRCKVSQAVFFKYLIEYFKYRSQGKLCQNIFIEMLHKR